MNVLHFDKTRVGRPKSPAKSVVIEVDFKNKWVNVMTEFDNINQTSKKYTARTDKVRNLNRKIAA